MAVSKRWFLFLGFVTSAASVVLACESGSTPGATAGDAGNDRATGDAGEEEDASEGGDSGSDASDAGADARAKRDANGPGDIDASCTFNADCKLALRCECDGVCFCKQGVRGTGQNGIDTCMVGEDCESSLCVEGQGIFLYCSDQCETSADCVGALPVCTNVAQIGKICVRDAG